MNSGAEAVETAIKVSRRWGYQVKGVAEAQASIVVMEGNFHGRTTTIVSFSNDSDATAGYAPYTPGFRMVPYGDIAAMRAAIDETTVAVLLEPIQGEGGVIIPPEGFLREVRALCDETERADGRRRDPVGSRPLRHDVRVRPRGRRPRHLHPRQGARRRALPRLGDRRGPRRPRRDHARQPRLDVRRQPAGRGHRPRGRGDAADRRVPGARRVARRAARRRARAAGRATASTPSASAACGAASTSPTAWPPAARSPRRCSARASSPRRPTARPSASPRPLVASEDDIDLLVAAFTAVMESFSS